MEMVASNDRRSRPVRLSVVASLVLAAGCATMGGASAGTDLGREWGCIPAEIEPAYRGNGVEASENIPVVGITGCQLLATLGPPDEFELTEKGTYLAYYRSGEKTHLVTLRQEFGSTWIVNAVVW